MKGRYIQSMLNILINLADKYGFNKCSYHSFDNITWQILAAPAKV